METLMETKLEIMSGNAIVDSFLNSSTENDDSSLFCIVESKS